MGLPAVGWRLAATQKHEQLQKPGFRASVPRWPPLTFHQLPDAKREKRSVVRSITIGMECIPKRPLFRLKGSSGGSPSGARKHRPPTALPFRSSPSPQTAVYIPHHQNKSKQHIYIYIYIYIKWNKTINNKIRGNVGYVVRHVPLVRVVPRTRLLYGQPRAAYLFLCAHYGS